MPKKKPKRRDGSARKHKRTRPCKMGREISRYLEIGTTNVETGALGTRRDRARLRRTLAAKLKVTPGYLQFLEVGEPRADGKPMRPSEALAAAWERFKQRDPSQAGQAMRAGKWARNLRKVATAMEKRA